jgi:EpsI family protein
VEPPCWVTLPPPGDILADMKNANIGNNLLLVALLAVGAIGWSLRLRPALEVDVAPLASLPAVIGIWRSDDRAMDAAVEAELRADLNLQRTYYGPAQAPVWLYIGYYGTDRGGRPEHTPRGCYPGAGWSIEQARVLDVAPERSLRGNEYLLDRDGEGRLVLFWYRSFRRTGLLGGLDQNIDRIIGRLSEGRADGALIRISTSLQAGGEIAARGRLMAFASELDPLLDEHWPVEHASR